MEEETNRIKERGGIIIQAGAFKLARFLRWDLLWV